MNFNSRNYSVNDFREWNERQELTLQPKFQRRTVWNEKARSYLIDTIIQGKPIPKIFMRQHIDSRSHKTVREIVDGQQRLQTIFLFLEDGFKISKIHSEEFGGMTYSDLPGEVKNGILKYELSVDLLNDVPDKEVLDIFSRLNSYAVKLNSQELRNAQYLGEFKQTAYKLAFDYTTFWNENKIFTDMQISRMAEVELTSDLLIAMIDGTKSRKAIEGYYKKYDDKLPDKSRLMREFCKTMDTIGELSAGRLRQTEFQSPVLFYSLFCALFHHLFGLKGLSVSRSALRAGSYPKIWVALESVEDIIKKDSPSKAESKFVDSLKRHTTDESVRQIRTEFIAEIVRF